jgi:putative RecB family exonuclease
MRYSHTRITTFENCPRKYKYQYLEKVTATLGDTIEAFMGSRVHDTLEKLYRDLMMTRLLSLEELAGYYEESWEKRWDDSIRVIRKEYTPEDYRKKGRKCVEDYYRRYHPFAQGRTIGIEERVSAALGEDRTLTGFIDRLVLLEGGTYEIHDYKTSGRLPPQEEVDNDRQLALYQLAVRTMWSDMKQVELVWHYLVFDRELRSARSPGQLEELEKEVNRLIESSPPKNSRRNRVPCATGASSKISARSGNTNTFSGS